MNGQKFALAAAGVFVTMMATGFVVHGLLLGSDYQALGSTMMRGEADSMAHLPFNALAHLCMALGIVWIYAQGVESKPWLGQGLRFGAAFWLIGSLGVYLIYFSVQPMPAALAAKQIGYGLPESLLMGVVVSALYRK